MAQLKNTQINDIGSIKLPAGTTAQRPLQPQPGMVRYNTDFNQTELYDGTNWIVIQDYGLTATGGIESNIVIGGVPYRIHAFTSVGSSTFTVTKPGEVDVLVVAGGGGGGSHVPGGGGAGGVVWKQRHFLSTQSYPITVGSGGNGSFNPGSYGGMPNATAGGNSTAFGLTAIGGGFGGSWTQDTRSNNGGSGGGRNTNRNSGQRLGLQSSQPGDSGTFGFGNNGAVNLDASSSNYAGGGGGGAGSAAPNPTSRNRAGNGGSGIDLSQFFGVAYGEQGWFAGGGGGGAWGNVEFMGDGGKGGGGAGDCPNSSSTGPSKRRSLGEPRGFAGIPTTGGGGGGAGRTGGSSSRGGNGGSGIVLVRYINYPGI